MVLEVADAAGAAVEQIFIIDVGNANDPPSITSTPITIAIEDSPYIYIIATSDPDVSDILSISALTIPDWLEIVDNGDRTAVLSGTPLNEHVGDNDVVLEVADLAGVTASQNFTISVSNTNDTPEFTSSPVTTAKENNLYLYNISTTDPDIGDVRAITAPNLPGWLSITDNGNGSASLTGTPAFDDIGQLNLVTLKVEDASGADTQQSFTIDIENANVPPTIQPINDPAPINEDSPERVITIRGITAGGEPDQQISSITAVSDNTELISEVVVNYTAPESQGTLVYTPEPDAFGSATITVTLVDDGSFNINTTVVDFVVTVNPINDKPIFTSTPITIGIANELYDYTVETFDADPGNTRIISAIKIPNWLTLKTLENGVAMLSGIAPPSDDGQNEVILKVEDQDGAANQQTFVILLNNAPILESIEVNSSEDSIFNFTGQLFTGVYSDEDNDPMTLIKITALPLRGELFLNNTLILENDEISTADINNLNYRPNEDFNGSDEFSWNAFDGTAFSDNDALVTIIVEAVNDPPVLSNVSVEPLQYSQRDDPTSISELITVTDIDDISIVSAEIAIVENYLFSEDELIFVDTDSITGSFDVNTGVLILTGSDSKSSYEQALQSVRYFNSNNDNTSQALRKVQFTINDGELDSEPVFRDIQIINVFPELDLVNALTPNGDGVNDTWNIGKLEFYQRIDILIHDQDGNELFRTDQMTVEWDGTYNGNELPSGSYFYRIQLNRGMIGERKYQGIVSILK